jgi:hypothetical protein
MGIALIVIGCIAALLAVLYMPKPQQKISRLGRLDLSRKTIIEKADEALRERGYAPEGYERVTNVYARSLPAEYLLEHGTMDRMADLYNTEFSDLSWTVRYFRFLQPEEFKIRLDQHGRFETWSHTVLREAPGAVLDRVAALSRAKDALARDAGIDLSPQELVQEAPMQQEQRRDWVFAFDKKDFGWGDAKLRTYIRLQGNEAVSLTRMVKVPDAWLLEHARKGWKQLISGEVRSWMGYAETTIIVVLLILATIKHLTPWRKAFAYALFPLAIKLAQDINQGLQFYAAYETTTPRAQYLVTQWGGLAVGLLTTYLGGVFVIGVALGFLRWAWGWTPDQLVAWPADRRQRGLFWRDTLLVAFSSIAAFWLMGLLDVQVLGHFWPAEVAAIHYWRIEEWAPWIGAVTEALHSAYGELIRLAISVPVLRLIWGRHPRLAWALLFLLPLLSLGTPETLGGFLWGLAYAEATLLLTAWLVLKVWRFNVMAVFLTYFMSSLWGSVLLFLRKGGPVYQWQAAPLIGLMALALAVGWWRHCSSKEI